MNIKSTKKTKSQDISSLVVAVDWKDIHSRSVTNRTGARGFILFVPPAAVLPRQMLAMTVLNQHQALSSITVDLVLHVVPDVWDTLLQVERSLRFIQRRHTHNSMERDQILCMESPNTSPQANELNPSCSGQTQSNRLVRYQMASGTR